MINPVCSTYTSSLWLREPYPVKVAMHAGRCSGLLRLHAKTSERPVKGSAA